MITDHFYIERRMVPLNQFIRETQDLTTACSAVHEYGRVTRDLAATNILPGDLLLNSFVVAPHGG